MYLASLDPLEPIPKLRNRILSNLTEELFFTSLGLFIVIEVFFMVKNNLID